MSKRAKQKTTNDRVPKMTVAKLRQHLFGGTQVPFWNYDPQQLTIGVEIEYFIGNEDKNGNIKLATKEQYLSITNDLIQKFNYRDMKLNDQPGRVSRDTDHGFIAVKPDFGWHILEISLPPRHSAKQIETLLSEVLNEIDSTLERHELKRLDRSFVGIIPTSENLVLLDRLSGIDKTFRSSASTPTAIPYFPSMITATHVHLNCCNEMSLKLMPYLFQIDALIRERFNRPIVYKDQYYENIRERLYADTLGPDYLLCNAPTPPPESISDLVNLMNLSPKIFPNDSFFPVRNMMFIRPSKYGTFEFRSSCSYHSVSSVIEIVQLRIAQLLTACECLRAQPRINDNDLLVEFNDILLKVKDE